MKTLRLLALASPFLLAACGDGYELTKTKELFPYGNQRTAGSGVAYVVAKMMPKKEVKLLPQSAPVIEETKVILDEMEKTFNDSMKK